ncbi:uncharacterized protein BDR25DRAFT_347211 [Lindgomyces ingoldianus]|uniref:Uncharacterized protein n=1 Tax=Lindgomyces ingoldianus TaxID=673940 RepID=A0ACB6Q906_9PLEO|nr:uncharacterized protein BDR25DRAFT_347211 [Lindgomyces ingoldianus]KAF2463443.1 hypothetical protein BDR25DRAFT_347211 [Lindgomyces ingoldianus]
MTRCASTRCTFANMNTMTDMSTISAIQVLYCDDKGFSPAGMTLPSTIEAITTASGAMPTTQAATTTNPGSRQTFGGPTSTSAPSSSTSSSLLSTAAKTGISIGVTACALLVALIIILLCRRRRPKPTFYPQPPSQNPQFQPPMAPTPYQNTPPFSPPQFAAPAPLIIPQQGQQQGILAPDVSPIDEKAPPLVGVVRKEVPRSKDEFSSPTPPPPAQTPTTQRQLELHGSVPPPRHEVVNDGQVTNTVSTRGMELDGQPQSQPHYQQSAQGPWQYPQHAAGGQELDGNQTQRHELYHQQGVVGQELDGNQRHELPPHGQGYGYGNAYGQHNRGTYEIGSGH